MARHMNLNIEVVDYDPENPRIAPYLEGVEGVNHEYIGEALQPGDAKFLELKQAIRTSGRLINPIIVKMEGERYLTIEGNTRLSIYKLFHSEDPENELWQTISALVYEDLDEQGIHAIRLQAHLVGVRNWSPFAKARYLFELYNNAQMPAASLVDFCGGNRHTVMRNIAAFQVMNSDYRDAVPEDQFDGRKFSLFYEAQKPKTNTAISRAGFTKGDFIGWVVEGKFEPRQELVRQLPAILGNQRAREVFLEKGAKEAIGFIDRPELRKELLEASLPELCYAVQEKIRDIKLSELNDIRQDDESVSCLEDTYFSIQNIVENELVKE